MVLTLDLRIHVPNNWAYPKGPCTQYLGTWDLGDSSCRTGLGQVYDYWVRGPLGLGV